jgi:ribosomal-protein-alanine N-acetyltransferase
MKALPPFPRNRPTGKRMNLENLTIRKMNLRDLDKVVSLSATSPSNPWSKQMFLEEMEHPNASCYVMTSGEPLIDSPVGFICFRNVGDESDLLNIGVDPESRGCGIGKKLMTFYAEECRQRGAKTLYLEVDPRNVPAVRLYLSQSYRNNGVRKNFYHGKFDALLMMRTV